MFKRKPKVLTPQEMEEIRTKDFFDCILPGTIKFLSDHYILGNNYCCVWVIREYPPSTEEQAILSQLADRSGVTLRIYHRLVEAMEQRKIIQNATRRNRLKSGGNDVNETLEAEGNLQDVIELLANLRKNKEPLLHTSVFMELRARSMDALKELQSEIAMELTRSKISVDRLTLRQKEGFLSVLPVGANQFGAQYERVLPASSVANMYPFNFSGKTDPQLFHVQRDERITHYFGDYGSHFFNMGVTDQEIQPVYEKALAVMEMDDAGFRSTKEFLHRGEIIGRMRDCLLAKELHPGEEVLFVGTEPYGGPGDFELRGGHIRFVDPERKTCTVRGSFFDMKDVPLRYVLGRYNAEITETHYGRPHVEVLFGEYPALAQQYLHEAEERWEQYETDAAAAPTQTM